MIMWYPVPVNKKVISILERHGTTGLANQNKINPDAEVLKSVRLCWIGTVDCARLTATRQPSSGNVHLPRLEKERMDSKPQE